MNDVGDVAMDKDLARIEARDHVGRHPAVRTSDPEELRCLKGGKAGKFIRILGVSLF